MFKQTMLAAIIALSPAVSMASDNCAIWQNVAEKVMDARQSGARMADLMAIDSDNESFDAGFRAVVSDAYAQPRFSTPEYQARSIRKFGNAVYLACYNQ